MIPDKIVTQVGLIPSAVPWYAVGRLSRRILLGFKNWLYLASIDHFTVKKVMSTYKMSTVRHQGSFSSRNREAAISQGIMSSIAMGTTQGTAACGKNSGCT